MKLKNIQKRLILLLIFNLFIFLLSCKKEEVSTQEVSTPAISYAKVDKTQVTLGDIITYELNINYAQKVSVEIPAIKNIFSDFSIVSEESKKPTLVDNRLIQIYKYKIQAKELGAYTINPIEVKYHIPNDLLAKYGKDGVTKTSKIFIEVKSVLKPEDKNSDIDDIKPIEQISVLTTTTIVLIVLAVLAVIGILIYLFYLFRKADKNLLAHEIAYVELDKLKKLSLIEKGETKAFYFNLSEILRGYLKNRFMLLALEKDTENLEKDIDKNVDISSEQKEFLKNFLETTDFYKFTDAVSEQNLANKLFEQTQNFVEVTKEVPENEKKK